MLLLLLLLLLLSSETRGHEQGIDETIASSLCRGRAGERDRLQQPPSLCCVIELTAFLLLLVLLWLARGTHGTVLAFVREGPASPAFSVECV